MFLCFHVLFLNLIGRLPTYLPVNKASATLLMPEETDTETEGRVRREVYPLPV
jgi:hypothetical protein